MPFDIRNVPQRLIDAVRNRTVIPLIGAGISAQAGGAEAFPNWRQLLLDLRDLAVRSGYLADEDGREVEQLMERGNYLMAAEALKYCLPIDEFESFLQDRFDPPGVHPTEIHRALFRLRAPMYITTNYDRLVENAYAREYGEAATVITYSDAFVAQKALQSGRLSSRPIIFKIHGTIDSPDGLILSEGDYRKLLHDSRGYRMVLSALFITHTVLMLGFSFADPELRLLLETHREALKHRSHPDYLLLPSTSAGKVETRRLREDFGVQIISYEPSAGHPEVLEFIQYLAQYAPQDV